MPRPEILTTLNLQGNNIKTFNNAPLMPNLKTLNLVATGLIAFDNVQPLPNLQNLNLNNNHLSDNLAGLKGCPNLETLNLSSTSISNIQYLRGLAKLRELDLSKNALETLDGLETLENLQWLNLKESLPNINSRLTTIEKVPSSLRYLQMERSTVTNLDFLQNSEKPLNLQVLIANNSKIGGSVNFRCAVNLKYIDLSNCRLAGISGFEYLPFDAYLDLRHNSLPLSQIYPLVQDVSYRIWKIGSQHDVFFEKLELGRNQPLDLSSEKEFNSIATSYIVMRKTGDGNDALTPPGDWDAASRNTDYVINGGVITFLATGEYRIYMKNKAVLQYPQQYYNNFEPYPITVYTGIITVL